MHVGIGDRDRVERPRLVLAVLEFAFLVGRDQRLAQPVSDVALPSCRRRLQCEEAHAIPWSRRQAVPWGPEGRLHAHVRRFLSKGHRH